ncbi:MAG TPA: c-type cytochrome [Candidatus Manganitrophaceae bacterium]
MKRFDPSLISVWAALLVVAGAIVSLVAALPRVKDMADQPSIKPQEAPFLPPPRSAPIQGRERTIGLLEAMALKNPAPATPDSIETGRRLFDAICAVCHGADAKGKGPISKKLVIPPADLTSASTAARPDGYYYVVMRQGGAVMPSQAEALSSRDRWDIVNYLRDLQRGGGSG